MVKIRIDGFAELRYSVNTYTSALVSWPVLVTCLHIIIFLHYIYVSVRKQYVVIRGLKNA